MPKVTDGGQKGFEDKPLDRLDLVEEIETYLENKEAAKAFRKADSVIKEALPTVDEPTRFWIGEQYSIEVTPQSVDGYEVQPRRQQRKRIREGHASS